MRRWTLDVFLSDDLKFQELSEIFRIKILRQLVRLRRQMTPADQSFASGSDSFQISYFFGRMPFHCRRGSRSRTIDMKAAHFRALRFLLAMPPHATGRLIGTGGASIKRIKESAGSVRLRIDNDMCYMDSEDKQQLESCFILSCGFGFLKVRKARVSLAASNSGSESSRLLLLAGLGLRKWGKSMSRALGANATPQNTLRPTHIPPRTS